MKSTYEKRWGHKRYRKATKHLEYLVRRRVEAKARQKEFDRKNK